MTGVAAALAEVVRELDAVENLSAADDPADLNAPAVLATVGAIRPSALLDGSGEVDIRLDLVAQDVAWRDATKQLDDMLPLVVGLGYPLAGDVLPISLVMPNGGSTLPAWRVTITTVYQVED